MRSRPIVCLVAATAVGLTLGSAPARAGITGSAHDFSTAPWNFTAHSPGEVCVICHTPHNARTDADSLKAPLWNHEVTSANFVLYQNTGTMTAAVGQPSGISKLCISCHDGTVALDAFGPATSGTSFAGDNARLGPDLRNDHPISFVYDSALAAADGELFDPATTASGLGDTIENSMLFGTAGARTLECASCHDVHSRSGEPKLLRKSNSGSALCLTCHVK